MSHRAPGPQHRRSQRDRMLAGELYVADDPQLAAEHLRALTLTRQLNDSDPADPERRRAVPCELLGSFGEAARSAHPCGATTATRPTSGPGPSTSASCCWTWPPSP